MGGRGARYGVSEKGRKYGTEYHTVLQHGNIKFIRFDLSTSASSPYDTRPGNGRRIYVTVNQKNEPKYITMYRTDGRRLAQIDVSGPAHYQDEKKIETPHIHIGYEHQGSHVRELNHWERNLLEKIQTIWYSRSDDIT